MWGFSSELLEGFPAAAKQVVRHGHAPGVRRKVCRHAYALRRTSGACRSTSTLSLIKRFEVLAGATIIGHSDLELGDAPMGVAGGQFVLSAEYASVRPACVAARESSQSHIGLSVRLVGGESVSAQGGVQIFDYSEELGGTGVEVHVNGIPYSMYERLFPEHVAAYAKRFSAGG